MDVDLTARETLRAHLSDSVAGLQLPELASAGSVWDRLIWPLLSLTWTAPGVDARLGRLQLVVLAARMFEQRAR